MKIQTADSMNKTTTGGIPSFITKYSTKGFTTQGNIVYGPVAFLPKSFYSWKVKYACDITIASLQLFTVVEPRVEILVIGTGEKQYLKDSI